MLWNQWPNATGMGGRMFMESVAECDWNMHDESRLILFVIDRPNGASDDRVNGATWKWLKEPFFRVCRNPYKINVFHPLSQAYFWTLFPVPVLKIPEGVWEL
jgi:hypothetical protein